MRNFVAASCCLIVGLEILVGVPVAVCLGFLCIGSEFGGAYMVEAQPSGVAYSAVPFNLPTLPATPQVAIVAPGQPLPAFDPYTPPMAPPSICPAPSPTAVIPPAVPTVASLPASDLAADAPSAHTSLALELAVAQTEQASHDAVPRDGPQFLARVCASESSGQSGHHTSPEAELLESLRETAQLLYRRAERHEADREYDLADHLRSLARDLRDEAASVSCHLPTEQPMSSNEPAERQATTVTVGPPPRG
jgi:hypothetical protein